MTVLNQELRREQLLEKPLPSNLEAEKIILGLIILNNDLMNQAIESLSPNMFYSPLHKKIFTAMVQLYTQDKPIDVILIGEEIKKTDSLEAIGGLAIIVGLTYGLPSFRNITNYIDVIVRKFKTREFIKVCGKAMNEALAEDEEIEKVVESHESEIYKITQNSGSKAKPQTVGELAVTAVKRLADNARNQNPLMGFSTGYKDLDTVMGGIRKKTLITVSARPSMGKSSYVFNIAQNVVDQDIERSAVVAIFSIEMSKKEIINKFLASDAKVDLTRLEKSFMTKEEWGKIAQSADKFSEQNIIIEDFEDYDSSVTPMVIKGMARNIKKEKKRLDLIIIDHLTLMKGSQKRYESTQKEISDITRELKLLSKSLDVPIILLTQLSRECEKRKPPIPILSDLRDSGGIEENADTCIFLYRESYYNETDSNKYDIDIYVRKNRNAPTGKASLLFFREFSRFENKAL